MLFNRLQAFVNSGFISSLFYYMISPFHQSHLHPLQWHDYYLLKVFKQTILKVGIILSLCLFTVTAGLCCYLSHRCYFFFDLSAIPSQLWWRVHAIHSKNDLCFLLGSTFCSRSSFVGLSLIHSPQLYHLHPLRFPSFSDSTS